MKRNMDDYSVEEFKAFMEATLFQGGMFYQYMHGERHEPDGANTILNTKSYAKNELAR